MQIDWSEWWGISMIASVFLVMGGVTGFRGGAKGLSLKPTLRRAARNGIVTVIVGTTILAVGIACFQLGTLGVSVREKDPYDLGVYWEEYPHVETHPEGVIHGLKLDYRAYWGSISTGPCTAPWCRCARCSPRHPLELNEVVDEAIHGGAIWAFLTPMWVLFGSVPLLGAATVGYHMGLGRQSFPPEA